jgi:dipeptide/tripeptide permease
MERPNYKWIHFLIISLLISAIVEFVLNWPISQVFNNSKQTYVLASLAVIVILMVASLLIWFINRLYFKKAETRSILNLFYNISSFIILFYVCFFGKISVISRLVSRNNLNKLFSTWHVHTADTGAYQTVTIFICIQVLFLIYLMVRSNERTA